MYNIFRNSTWNLLDSFNEDLNSFFDGLELPEEVDSETTQVTESNGYKTTVVTKEGNGFKQVTTSIEPLPKVEGDYERIERLMLESAENREYLKANEYKNQLVKLKSLES